jgi:hypothetical protein
MDMLTLSRRYSQPSVNVGFDTMYLKLSVHYTDGSKYSVVSDTTWGVTSGPVQMSDIYNGETYDARYVK